MVRQEVGIRFPPALSLAVNPRNLEALAGTGVTELLLASGFTISTCSGFSDAGGAVVHLGTFQMTLEPYTEV